MLIIILIISILICIINIINIIAIIVIIIIISEMFFVRACLWVCARTTRASCFSGIFATCLKY